MSLKFDVLLGNEVHATTLQHELVSLVDICLGFVAYLLVLIGVRLEEQQRSWAKDLQGAALD